MNHCPGCGEKLTSGVFKRKALVKVKNLQEAKTLLQQVEDRLEGIDSEDATTAEKQIWKLLHTGHWK